MPEKAPILAELKTKDGAVISHNQSCNSSIFQSQISVFVDPPVMCIFFVVKSNSACKMYELQLDIQMLSFEILKYCTSAFNSCQHIQSKFANHYHAYYWFQ